MWRTGMVLLLVLTLSGCSKLAFWRKSAPQQQQQPATQAPAASGTPAASSLFPEKDLHVDFLVRDHGAATDVAVQEELLRDRDRLVGLYGGVPYVNWVFKPDGVWRPDPHGGEALLLYLPAQLQDGETWKQTSAKADVWFRLQHVKDTCQGFLVDIGTRDCWQLTVLNQGEKLVFHFAAGLGPVHASAENWRRPADSYVKRIKAYRPGDLGAEQRTAVLGRVKPPALQPATVSLVSEADFNKAAGQMQAGR